MPKVNREEYYWVPVGTTFREKIYREIFYTSKRNKFYAPLPEIVAKFLDKKEVEADSLEACKNLWNRTLQEYIDRNTQKKKVIAYKVEANAIVYGNDDKIIFRREDIDDWGEKRTGLTIAYTICYESIYNKEKEYVDENNNNAGIGSDYKIIEWNPQREEFFNQMELRLAYMVQKIFNFLTKQNKKRLLETIDSGMKLLPSIKHKEKEKI